MMIVVYGIVAYLLISVVIGSACGIALKMARCNRDGVSWNEDTHAQDQAQLTFLQSRRIV